MPGDTEGREAIADPGNIVAEDACRGPVSGGDPRDGMEKPYFGMGDAKPSWSTCVAMVGRHHRTVPAEHRLLNARGVRPTSWNGMRRAAGLRATGVYTGGTWRVVMTRPLAPNDPEKDIRFAEGRFIPDRFRRLGRQQRRDGLAAHHDHLVLAAA